MNANPTTVSESGQPVPTDRAYSKLVSNGTRLLKAGTAQVEVERAIRIDAFYLIPRNTPDRREHAADLALQAITDAGAESDIAVE